MAFDFFQLDIMALDWIQTRGHYSWMVLGFVSVCYHFFPFFILACASEVVEWGGGSEERLVFLDLGLRTLRSKC